MHIDLNSCFASVEQQANPLLRGKPVAVAAYTSPNGCILAVSIEAKCFGVKTGMRVRDGKALCPGLVVLPSDPWKYRYINRKLLALLGEYSSEVEVKSIDEMVMDLSQSPTLRTRLKQTSNVLLNHTEDCSIVKLLYCWKKEQNQEQNNNLAIEQFNNLLENRQVVRAMMAIGQEIKVRIKDEIGDWLTVSVGIAPNRFLAKTAAGLHKPDGLDVIDRGNVEEVLFAMELEDLCGIKKGNAGRLRLYGVKTIRDFYRAPMEALKTAFRSIVGCHWWMRLHGYEIDLPAGRQATGEFGRKSFGHSYALYKPYKPAERPMAQILAQLVAKMGRRLRRDGYRAQGIHVSVLYADYSLWHHGQRLASPQFADRDLYRSAHGILEGAPVKPVRILSVSCFRLSRDLYRQQALLEEEERTVRLTRAVDSIADRWGDFAVTSGRMLSMEPASTQRGEPKVLDRIAFGGVAGLEEFMFQEPIDNVPEYI